MNLFLRQVLKFKVTRSIYLNRVDLYFFLEYGQFDFIIVGAGSSGCVLADKLSKNGKWKVLLLEAGSDDTKFSDIPGMASFLLKSKMNWGYYSKPQTRCCQGYTFIKYICYHMILTYLFIRHGE